MSFPPSLPPTNNPLFPGGYPAPPVPPSTNVPPPLPRFPIMPGLAPPLVPMPMGVTVPAGVASISAPPIRKQNAAVIAAPPVIALNPQQSAAMLYAQNPKLPSAMTSMTNPTVDTNKKMAITTVFVGNITDRASDMLIRQLLSKCGSVHNWKRIQGPDGKLQAFGFCDYADPESAMRAIRLLHEFMISDKKLIVKADAKTQEKLDEYNKLNKKSDKSKNTADDDDDDKIIRQQLQYVLREHEIELSKEPDKDQDKKNKQKEKDSKNENLSDMDIEDDKRNLIHREIDKFRDTYKKYDEEKEEEKRKKEERQRHKENNNSNSNNNNDNDNSSINNSKSSKSSRRSRSKDVDTKRRSNDKRNNRVSSKDYHRKNDRNRKRDQRSSSFESESREQRNDPLLGNESPESPVDEEELLLRRRRQEQNREKELSYQRRLRDWENREKRKAREYEREQEKEIRRKKEEEIEKQKLKQFLQDYDDLKHDEKYYSGKSLLQRQADRRKEIEQDNYERQQELKELEELRRKLNQEGHPDPESELRKHFNVQNSNNDEYDDITMMKSTNSNNYIDNDESSQHSLSNQQPQSAVKTFGFVGMKISNQNLDHINNADNDGAQQSSSSLSDRISIQQQQQQNVKTQHQQAQQGSAKSSNIDAAIKRKKMTVSDVFNSNDDDDHNSSMKKRRPPPNTLFEDSSSIHDNSSQNQNKPSINQSSIPLQMTKEEKRILIKNLIDEIPTSKTEIFNYKLDWSQLDNNLMEQRIRPWISKKIKDYIGEEDTTFLNFICQKLLTKNDAQSLLDDVAMVLDDEAQVFIVKLWRLLIYEIEAKKLGINKYAAVTTTNDDKK